MRELHSYPVTLDGSSVEQKRQEIKDYFNNSFDVLERVFSVLKSETTYVKKSEPTRHPVVFYLGHTATFYINKLVLAKVLDERVNPHYESLFATGVDEMSWDDMEEKNYTWPKVDEVYAYRRVVRTKVNHLIDTLPLTLPIQQEDPFWVVLMGIEHERIHIETSSVLHRQLPLGEVQYMPYFPLCQHSGAAPENTMVSIDGGPIRLGKDKSHHLYGWDNEYGESTVELSSFLVSRFLVSNGEFLPFVEAGGYDIAEYWDEEGLSFLATRGATCPVFWQRQDDGSFFYRSFTDITPMPMNWPVEVNYLEAKAFCRWKGKKEGKTFRLPTEAEWYQLYQQSGLRDVPQLDDSLANINLAHYASSCPVDTFQHGAVFDVIGNVWQWTESAIDAFNGFEVHPMYDDFSTPTFDNKHNVMKGGSWISTGNELMKHSRYAFRRHFYQHAGFRYVEALSNTAIDAAQQHSENIYETDALVAQYCEFQYGEPMFGVKNYAVALSELVNEVVQHHRGRVLDIGCATGRACFELSKTFEHVTGIDFSARFIKVAVELMEKGELAYQRGEEGSLTSLQRIQLSDLGCRPTANNVEFWQGDACNLKPHFKHFDVVMASNLIDRLYKPLNFLREISKRMNQGGVLVISSPYTWLEEYTDKDDWLGGYINETGQDMTTLQGLQLALGDQFDLVSVQDMEFVIRETPRKYQHSIAEVSVWRLR